MDILEQLKREHARRNGSTAQGESSAALERAIETLYAGLERLAEALRKLNPDVRVSYEIESVGNLDELRQQDYGVETEDPTVPRFAFTFNCIGHKTLTRIAATVEQKEHIRHQLEGLGLSLKIDDMSTWRYVITLKPIVPVRLVFEPTPGGCAIRMTAHNLDRLGVKLYSLHPGVVRTELINELGKLVLRRENRFAEFSGNRVDSHIRQKLQDRVRARQRSREQIARDLNAEESTRPGRLKGLLRGRGQTKMPAQKVVAAPEPDLKDESEASGQGFIDWNGETRDEPAHTGQPEIIACAGELDRDALPLPALLGDTEPGQPPAALPNYAWLITEDARADDTSASVGRHGPNGAARAFTTLQVLNEGEEFRLMNREGEIRFNGRITGEYQGVEPLVDFGMDRDCYLIEYHRRGQWVRVRPID
jgi:hypothetical protein